MSHKLREAISYYFGLDMQKTVPSNGIIVYSLLFTLILLISSSPLVFITSNQRYTAYAHEFKGCNLEKTVQIETESNKRFKIEQDFEVDISEEPETPEDICKDTDAKDAKKLKLESGETITVEFVAGIEDTGIICLADKHKSDSSIALGEGSCDADGIDIVRFECDSPQEPTGACDTGKFEIKIPEDIDRGKYKIVIGETRGGDEVLDLYISKVKIK